MKLRLFTHIDLDGIGAGVLALLAFDKKVEITCHGFNDIDNAIRQLIESKKIEEYEKVYVVDVSPNEETMIMMNRYEDRVLLYDHHASNLPVKEKLGYPWIHLDASPSVSGTSLFYDAIKHLIPEDGEYLQKFVELVTLFDTWKWAETWNIQAVALHRYQSNVSAENRITNFASLIRSKTLFDKIADVQIDKFFARLEEASKNILYPVDNFLVGVDLEDVSVMGEIVRRSGSTYDALLDIRPSGARVGIRSISSDFDCIGFVKQFGGGGHPKAAGFTLPKETVQVMVKAMFESMQTKKSKSTMKKVKNPPEAEQEDGKGQTESG